MINPDLFMMWCYIIGSVLWVGAGISALIMAKTSDKVIESIGIIIAGLTPIAIIVPIILGCVLLWFIFVFLPARFFCWIKGIKEENKFGW